jgi:hypothetical protein
MKKMIMTWGTRSGREPEFNEEDEHNLGGGGQIA